MGSINRLSALFVRGDRAPGLYPDGGGLYLLTSNGGKRWVFRYKLGARRREMGLGPVETVSLGRARELAAVARDRVANGLDPISERERAKVEARREEAGPPTFGSFAETFISSLEGGWRNPKHRQQWRNSLKQHAGTLNGKLLSEITTQDVLGVLLPIWLPLPETARRVRGRIERILDAAKALGHRPADSINPATWRGHMKVLLPEQRKEARAHHAAMPYAQVPLLMRRLADRPAMAARALEFLILTAGRTGEVLGARWQEIEGDVWAVPADRMKAGKPHTVPLTGAAQAILDAIGHGEPADYVFKGAKGGMLSNMALLMLLRRMKLGEFTAHGFRSAFKDWALDCTAHGEELSEEALAHVVGNKVRNAYRRGSALERRRVLMADWAAFVNTAPAPLEIAA